MQSYSPMARRRLKVFTLLVLFVIVLLTFIARRFDSEKPNKLSKHYYTPVRLHQEKTDLQGSNIPSIIADPIINGSRPPRLTRYGASLQFDPDDRCPPDSLMHAAGWKHLRPRTSLCPEVFVIGAKKGGTTSLIQYLSKHPDFEGIRLNEVKWVGETFYFAQKYTSMSLSQYVHLFPRNKMSGDASVDNLLFCKSPERIFKTCGFKPKIIILLRHPIKRYISNFMMRIERPVYTMFNTSTSISETTHREHQILKNAIDHKGVDLPQNRSDWTNYRCLFSCCTSMIYEGMYYVFVMNWLCNFPKENIMILNSDEMFAYTGDIYKEVLTFLGLKPLAETEIQRITSMVYNKSPEPNQSQYQLKEDDIHLLNSIYKSFNKELLELLNWSSVNWS